jgi:group I intron endonuclease
MLYFGRNIRKGDKMISGIYVIENLINNKKYVGQGEDVEFRMWQKHRGCRALNRAIKKYGENNFNRYIIEYCSIKKLDKREQYWIKKLHSHVSENGYNISWGGNTPNRGISTPEEVKKKIRDSQSGEKGHWYRKHFSEETLKKMREERPNTKGENNPMYKIGENHPNFGKHLSN